MKPPTLSHDDVVQEVGCIMCVQTHTCCAHACLEPRRDSAASSHATRDDSPRRGFTLIMQNRPNHLIRHAEQLAGFLQGLHSGGSGFVFEGAGKEIMSVESEQTKDKDRMM